MRESAGRLNRTWLAIIGLATLILGIAGVLLASGLAGTIAQSAGAGFSPAEPADPALPEGFRDVFANDAAPIILAVLAVLIGIGALLWLLAQIPRRNQARAFRLHGDNGSTGYTTCEPRVLTDAVEQETAALPGVTGATALLRGTAAEPELTIDVRVDDRADVQDVLEKIHAQVASNLETALETPLRKVAVLFNVTARRRNDHEAVL
ncbi:alkaline shock response membrane anchor protein AmaP [Arthrobacter sp. Br18]|uniref:alkaline shock response membrane anchor protein AmaP n=1 Tax=Arthrobacter sp. Br18 TaxID=1312954 RepID=UPI00047E89CC|nr:alkaline shock response membrane anchor protein AmaP [Arthrobacter sp. Br18]